MEKTLFCHFTTLSWLLLFDFYEKNCKLLLQPEAESDAAALKMMLVCLLFFVGVEKTVSLKTHLTSNVNIRILLRVIWMWCNITQSMNNLLTNYSKSIRWFHEIFQIILDFPFIVRWKKPLKARGGRIIGSPLLARTICQVDLLVSNKSISKMWRNSLMVKVFTITGNQLFRSSPPFKGFF